MCLEIVGSGDQEPALRAQAAELGILAGDDATQGVVFLGWQSQRECARRLAASDVLVLPSILECGGAVVLEAMAMAKPVIAAAWGGPLDYLDHECGVLVAPDGDDALVRGFATAMARLAQMPADRERLGRNGRKKVLRDYDWDVKVTRMLAVYAEAAGVRPVEAT
jgi:glycosyltransferase involved in cell wall biosynthesis